MTVTKAKLPTTFPNGWFWGVPMVLGVIASGVPTYATACDEKKICVKYTTNEFQDNSPALGAEPLGVLVVDPDTGVGQRLVDATGVRVTIIRPPPEPPLGMHLDEDGCVEFPTQFSAGHQVVVHPDALVGVGQDVRITVHDWDATLFFDEFDISEGTLVPRPGDICDIPPIADGMDVWCSPSEHEWWATMAVATHFVNKLDALPGSPLSGEDLDFVALDNTATNGPGLAFYSSSTGNLALGQATARHRFLVAHEMGHWIHSRVQLAEEGPAGLRPQYNYPAPCHVDPIGPDLACQFAVVYVQPALSPFWEMHLKGKLESHGIRSSEYSSGAMVEGFAQFTAAVAFNDISEETGMFVYYKDIDISAVPAYEAFVESGGYRVLLPGGSPHLGGTAAWVENECPNDFDTIYGDGDSMLVPTAISSEIDWLRFFWEFLTLQSEPPQPEFWEIPQLLAHALIHDSDPWSVDACTDGVLNEMRVCEPIIRTLAGDPGNVGLDAYVERFDAIEPSHQVCR